MRPVFFDFPENSVFIPFTRTEDVILTPNGRLIVGTIYRRTGISILEVPQTVISRLADMTGQKGEFSPYGRGQYSVSYSYKGVSIRYVFGRGPFLMVTGKLKDAMEVIKELYDWLPVYGILDARYQIDEENADDNIIIEARFPSDSLRYVNFKLWMEEDESTFIEFDTDNNVLVKGDGKAILLAYAIRNRAVRDFVMSLSRLFNLGFVVDIKSPGAMFEYIEKFTVMKRFGNSLVGVDHDEAIDPETAGNEVERIARALGIDKRDYNVKIIVIDGFSEIPKEVANVVKSVLPVCPSGTRVLLINVDTDSPEVEFRVGGVEITVSLCDGRIDNVAVYSFDRPDHRQLFLVKDVAEVILDEEVYEEFLKAFTTAVAIYHATGKFPRIDVQLIGSEYRAVVNHKELYKVLSNPFEVSSLELSYRGIVIASRDLPEEFLTVAERCTVNKDVVAYIGGEITPTTVPSFSGYIEGGALVYKSISLGKPKFKRHFPNKLYISS